MPLGVISDNNNVPDILLLSEECRHMEHTMVMIFLLTGIALLHAYGPNILTFYLY